MFIGRTQELAALKAALDAPDAALIVVTGRRRVGKSRLVREACRGRTVIHLPAQDETGRLIFDAFKRACLTHFGDHTHIEQQTEWLGLLSSVAIAAKATPGLVIVFDNFTALSDAEEAIAGIIRTFWLSGLPALSGLKLILSGANITRMTELAHGTPGVVAHSLATCEPLFFDLLPLPVRDAAQFFPGYTDEARIAAYAIFGGVPAYLEACNPDEPLRANIVRLILSPDGRLIDEPSRQLAAEMRDIKVYASILRAISNGYHESGEIRSFVMGDHSGVSISSYLEKLRLMRFIGDNRSIDAGPKARYIRFTVSDALFRFWNLFVQPNRAAIDAGDGDQLFETTIKRQLGDYMLPGFEAICREFMRLHGDEVFGASAENVGQAWGQGYHIAVAGRLIDQRPLFGASEWHTRAVGSGGADYLIRQARLSEAAAGATIHPHPAYALFARSGFTDDIRERAKEADSLKLITPAQIVRRAS